MRLNERDYWLYEKGSLISTDNHHLLEILGMLTSAMGWTQC